MKTCVNCGCVIEDGNWHETNDGIVCDDCFESEYTECYDCGEIIRISDAYYVHGNYYVCEDCSTAYEQCNRCGDLVDRYDAYYVRDYGYVCDDCIDSWEFHYCDVCGEYVQEDDWDCDSETCIQCAEENIIKPYHYHKGDIPRFYGDDTWFFGVEWEINTSDCCAYDDNDVACELSGILGDRAYFEWDCSVSGFECIFQPHTYDELKSEVIHKAFDKAKALSASGKNAGMHVHVSRTAFGDTAEEQNDNIAKLFILFQKGFAFDMLAKLSRREEYQMQWCRPLRHVERLTKKELKDTAKIYADGYGDHGVALNCENHATVEFRLGASTVEYGEFLAWIDIIKLLVETCKTISIDDAHNFYIWFANADESLKCYMETRGVKWEEPIVLTTEDYRNIIESLMDKVNDNLVASGAESIDYNSMLTLVCNANVQTRASLGFM